MHRDAGTSGWEHAVQRGLTGAYRRLGAWYPIAYIVALVVLTSVGVVTIGAEAWRVFGVVPEGEDDGWMLWTWFAFAVPPGLVIFACIWRGVVASVRWSAGGTRTQRDAEATWRELIGIPARFARMMVLLGFPAATAYGVAIAVHYDHSFSDALIICLSLVAPLSALIVIALNTLEFAIRPLLLDAAEMLPPGSHELPPAPSLRVRLPVGVAVMTFLTAIFTVTLVIDQGSPADMFRTIWVAGLVTLGVGVGISAVLAVTVLVPIGELLRGTQRIQRGDFDESIPVLSGDELGEVATSLNQATEGLAEREALREDVRRQADELRASRARIVAASDAARRRVERDLHDGAQQHLVLLRLKVDMLERALRDGPERASAQIAELRAEVDHALSELRDLAHGIYPALLESEGLPAALSQAAESAAIAASVEADRTGRYPAEVEAAVYFCCLEALQNAAKYAGDGARVCVSLAQENGTLRFEVADDGAGFDPEAGGHGLQNMADRIGALGGEVRIESAPGEGATVVGELPVSQR